LLSATRRPWYVRADPMERWTDTLTGKCEVVPVQGDHMSILKPPLVTLLADKILSIINSSESE
jgi:thioesterase domain-containing protein